MKIVSAFALTTLVLSTATTTKTSVNAQAVGDGPAENELPITTTDVFIQSGEIKPDSAVVMARCNTEIDSYVTLNVGDQTYEGQAYAARDYTISIQVTDLTPQTVYTYTVECASMQDPTQTVTSSEGTLKTLPTEDDDEFDFSFIWVSCLSGQGWGRNPDFELTTVDGKMVKGGYIVFDTMLDLAPDFAIFQGDMVYVSRACVRVCVDEMTHRSFPPPLIWLAVVISSRLVSSPTLLCQLSPPLIFSLPDQSITG